LLKHTETRTRYISLKGHRKKKSVYKTKHRKLAHNAEGVSVYTPVHVSSLKIFGLGGEGPKGKVVPVLN
jgi:hypothetical protein